MRACHVDARPELAEPVATYVNAVVEYATAARRRTLNVPDLFRDVLNAALAATPAEWEKTGKARADFRRRLGRLRDALADRRPRRGRPRSLTRAVDGVAGSEPLGPRRGPVVSMSADDVRRAAEALAALPPPAREALRRALRRGQPVPPGDPWFFRRFDPLLRPGAVERLSPEQRQAWAADVEFALSTIAQPPNRLAEPREAALIRALAQTARRYTSRPLDREAAAVFAAVTGQGGMTPGSYQRRRARLKE